MKRRFKLLAGQHYAFADDSRTERVRHTAGQNDIVESDEDLITKYPNKFELIRDPLPVVVTEERRKAAQELIAAGHWTEEDRTFLEELKDDQFLRILKKAGLVAETEPDEPPAPTKPKGKAGILGEDVTDRFQRAYDENLKVFVNSTGKFQVTKQSNTKKPLNHEPLEDEEQVIAFLDDYLKA